MVSEGNTLTRLLIENERLINQLKGIRQGMIDVLIDAERLCEILDDDKSRRVKERLYRFRKTINRARQAAFVDPLEIKKKLVEQQQEDVIHDAIKKGEQLLPIGNQSAHAVKAIRFNSERDQAAMERT